MEKKEFRPFLHGTEAQQWQRFNCEKCVRAWFPDPDKPTPSDKAIREYVRIGKYCRLQYYIDMGYVSGVIPEDVADQIGRAGNGGLNKSCNHFSDDKRDRFKYPSAVPPQIEKMKAIDLGRFDRKFEVIKSLVRKILTEIPATRDDDNFLLWAFMYRIEPSLDTLSVPILFQRMIRGDFGNPQTVFRARRKIQEHDEHLRGKWYGTRKKRADMISNYFSDYRAQFMGSFSGDLLFTEKERGEK